MKKISLLAPGSTPVSPRTLLAMALIGEVREGHKKIFQTQNEVPIFCCNGTGAMESSVANLLSPGDKAIAVAAASSASVGQRF